MNEMRPRPPRGGEGRCLFTTAGISHMKVGKQSTTGTLFLFSSLLSYRGHGGIFVVVVVFIDF